MKFKIIATIVFILFVLFCMVSCNVIKNSANTGYDQTEQYQQ